MHVVALGRATHEDPTAAFPTGKPPNGSSKGGEPNTRPTLPEGVHSCGCYHLGDASSICRDIDHQREAHCRSHCLRRRVQSTVRNFRVASASTNVWDLPFAMSIDRSSDLRSNCGAGSALLFSFRSVPREVLCRCTPLRKRYDTARKVCASSGCSVEHHTPPSTVNPSFPSIVSTSHDTRPTLQLLPLESSMQCPVRNKRCQSSEGPIPL